VAEELVLGHMTTGAGNDIERATDLARKMVCEFGMSEKMGPLTFGKRNEQIFLGREFAQHKDYSEQTAIEIDAEVRRIVMENYAKARLLLQENLAALNALAAALLEKESLDGPDIDRIIAESRGAIAPAEPSAV
jgi:cell division protease FtsH